MTIKSQIVKSSTLADYSVPPVGYVYVGAPSSVKTCENHNRNVYRFVIITQLISVIS